MRTATPSELPSYRLRGELDGNPLSFNVPRRDSVLGSDRACDFVLPVRGVSRRHATLTWQGRDLLITDLASKNGTFVNQLRAQAGPIRPGDTIRLGPVTLTLDSLEVEDAVLALPARSSAALAAQDLTAPWFDGAAHTPPDAWELFAELLKSLLDSEPPDFARALRLAGAQAGARAGLLVDVHSAGEVLALASFGTAADLPAEGELALAAPLPGLAGGDAWLADAPEIRCWSRPTPGGGRLLLVLRLGGAEAEAPRALGEALLRLAALPARRAAGRAAVRPEAPAVQPGMGLVRAAAPAMQAVYRQIGELRRTNFPVLILGETGVGKEHLVRLLHDSSPVARGPFVALNCAAIPAELLEAELFGIGKGVATGVAERAGKLREADGGTLFLDEIGDMPLPLQAKLLRALESGAVDPLGGARVAVKVRFVAATNADLAARIGAGQFRADLLYRLGGYQLRVPPLRERREDIAPLLEHFIARASRETGKEVAGITLKALRLLESYAWPGNVRQLANEVRRLVVQCPAGGAIDSGLLPPEIQRTAKSEPRREEPAGLDLEAGIEALERQLITRALAETRGSRAAAAKILGLSRNGLAAKMDRLGIAVQPRILAPSEDRR